MRRPVLLLSLILATPAMGQIRDEAGCAAAIAADPAAAREAAADWARSGGGTPARLCEAAALQALGAVESAARLLTELGQDPASGLEAGARAGVLAEAGALWWQLGAAGLARETLDRAARLAPADTTIGLLLAEVELALGDPAAALPRLDDALDHDGAGHDHGADPKALLLRAQARRRTGDLSGAAADLALLPDTPAAWLERGALAEAEGTRDLAVEAYFRVIAMARGSAEAQAAQEALQRLAD